MKKVPVILDSFSEEALLNLDEIRLQLNTQLEPSQFENLFFDLSGSADGCNNFALMMNLKNVTTYNLETIKERLRWFTEKVKKRVMANVEDEKSKSFFQQKIQMNVAQEDPDEQKAMFEKICEIEAEMKRQEQKIKQMKSEVSQGIVQILDDDDSEEEFDFEDKSPDDLKNQEIRDKFILEQVPEWLEQGQDQKFNLVFPDGNKNLLQIEPRLISETELRNNRVQEILRAMEPDIQNLKQNQLKFM